MGPSAQKPGSLLGLRASFTVWSPLAGRQRGARRGQQPLRSGSRGSVPLKASRESLSVTVNDLLLPHILSTFFNKKIESSVSAVKRHHFPSKWSHQGECA